MPALLPHTNGTICVYKLRSQARIRQKEEGFLNAQRWEKDLVKTKSLSRIYVIKLNTHTAQTRKLKNIKLMPISKVWQDINSISYFLSAQFPFLTNRIKHGPCSGQNSTICLKVPEINFELLTMTFHIDLVYFHTTFLLHCVWGGQSSSFSISFN